MTVIAWDGKTLAADRQMTWADMRSTVCKLRQLPSGEVLGVTGDSVRAISVLRWYEDGADPEKWPKCQGEAEYARLIVARHGGKLVYFDWCPVEQIILDPYMAFGVGRDFAMGAMAMGADAQKAVAIACRFSVGCGLGIDAFEIS